MLPRAFAVRGQDFEVKERKWKLFILRPLSGAKNDRLKAITPSQVTRNINKSARKAVSESSKCNKI